MKTNDMTRNKPAFNLNLAAGLLLIITGITASIVCAAIGNSIIGNGGFGGSVLHKSRITAGFITSFILLSPILMVTGIYSCCAKQKKCAMFSTLLSVATTVIVFTIFLFLLHLFRVANIIYPEITILTSAFFALAVSIASSIVNIINTVKIRQQSSTMPTKTNKNDEINDDNESNFEKHSTLWAIIIGAVVSVLLLLLVALTLYGIIDVFANPNASHQEESGYFYFIILVLNYFFAVSAFLTVRATIGKIRNTAL